MGAQLTSLAYDPANGPSVLPRAPPHRGLRTRGTRRRLFGGADRVRAGVTALAAQHDRATRGRGGPARRPRHAQGPQVAARRRRNSARRGRQRRAHSVVDAAADRGFAGRVLRPPARDRTAGIEKRRRGRGPARDGGLHARRARAGGALGRHRRDRRIPQQPPLPPRQGLAPLVRHEPRLDQAATALVSGRPAIGLSAAVEQARFGVWDQQATLLPHTYAEAVQAAGGLAFLLPPDDEAAEHPAALLDRIDALLLAGGRDVDPLSYGARPAPETAEPQPERDRFELALVTAALDRDMPVLGVCRGMQMLNVACGGTLVQHLDGEIGARHRHTPGVFSDHDVALEAGSLASRAAGAERIAVRSHHHQ